ncbi:hypothetical protein SAMN05216388_10623 [Halorientalis persicus]|uniref:Uncharacterized protein n=1 Tax=Halorientalis persicus TaxID=1367881 RepID=A0A1H8WJL3_9EURY|nr:hypothetical protein [Halorientalis persicus]SEP27860.1 hypothetical protein SAMN05216388_10623 [Halorientalis persicus]
MADRRQLTVRLSAADVFHVDVVGVSWRRRDARLVADERSDLFVAALDVLFEILTLDEGAPYVVRSYHWENGIPLEYTPAESESDYWEMLGETVNEALNR